MIKKTSLVLMALVGVFGTSCRADLKFFNSLGAWKERETLLTSYGKEVQNSGGSSWDNTTINLFKDYQVAVNDFKDQLKSFSALASALTGQAYVLADDGTNLYNIQNTASELKNDLLNGKKLDDYIKIYNAYTSLQAKINAAQTAGISVDNLPSQQSDNQQNTQRNTQQNQASTSNQKKNASSNPFGNKINSKF